jgi:hypothetical protein
MSYYPTILRLLTLSVNSTKVRANDAKPSQVEAYLGCPSLHTASSTLYNQTSYVIKKNSILFIDFVSVMRLLNATTAQFEVFADETIAPPYAILSHTWGEDEVTFEDMQENKINKASHGYWKIERCTGQAKKDGFDYIWVDTCLSVRFQIT